MAVALLLGRARGCTAKKQRKGGKKKGGIPSLFRASGRRFVLHHTGVKARKSGEGKARKRREHFLYQRPGERGGGTFAVMAFVQRRRCRKRKKKAIASATYSLEGNEIGFYGRKSVQRKNQEKKDFFAFPQPLRPFTRGKGKRSERLQEGHESD